MKSKKGFTLVELLSVIVILSLTITVGFYAITKSISSSKEKAYQEQINRIINLSKSWTTDNLDELPTKNEKIYITFNDLRNDKLIEGDILNPKDNTEIDGCIKVYYDSEKNLHNYEFQERKDCPDSNLKYQIHYNLNEGVLDRQNPTQYTIRTDTFILNNPKKEGYAFRGWKTPDSEEPNPAVTIYKGTIGDLSFEAIFDLSLVVTIDPNGGNYAGYTEKVSTYYEPYTVLPLEIPERKNYHFLGWEANIDDVTIDGNNIKLGTTSVTLTAIWSNCIPIEGKPVYEYTGQSTYIDDGNGKYRLKFLTSGTLTLNCPTKIDVFLVGGGSANGGSGYTQTYKSVNLEAGHPYVIDIGIGGTPTTIDGTASYLYIDEGTYYTAAAGSGKNGGSGGGASGYVNSGLNGAYNGGDNSKSCVEGACGGTGQGYTTCEFSEEISPGVCLYNDNGYDGFYAGGGGGGQGSGCKKCTGSNHESDYIAYPGKGGKGGGGKGGCENGVDNTGGGAGLGNRGEVKCSGGSGIVIIKNIVCDENEFYCYSGKSEYIKEENGNWKIKFLTSGTLKFNEKIETTTIDAFLVGGGSSHGGGGYTLTQTEIPIEIDKEYEIVVGAGGIPGKDGFDTTAFDFIAKAADGVNGGSGAGGSGYTSPGGDGGSDGGDGEYGSNGGRGTGQILTTREFGEPNGTLYAGGGGGGGGAIYGDNGQSFSGGKGGEGGGGNGSKACTNGGNGITNTGGGAGKGTRGAAICYGGSGVVIIRNAR